MDRRDDASSNKTLDTAVLQKKLIDAAKGGIVEKISEICVTLPSNFDINNVFEKSFYGTRDGTPLLHLACSSRNPSDILKILVKFGANLWSKKLDGLNLLHYACKRKNLEAIQFILRDCPDVSILHSPSDAGYDALYYATESYERDPEEGKKVIELLLSQGKFNINRFRKDGSTEVLKSVVESKLDLVSLLCKLGADVNLGYHSSKRAIHWVSEQSGYHDMVQLLIDHGANKNEVWRHCQRPIHLALKHGLARNAEVLLRSGVDISGSIRLNNPKYLWISTFCLAARRCPSLIPEFLARGANPNEIHYPSGFSVLGFAIENGGSREVIKSLIKAGANIANGCHGKSAIKCCKRIDQILAFLDCEISMKTIENDLGTNLIEMALSNDYSSQETVVENVKLLISKGADLKDPRIGSVLIEALLKKNHRIADFLIENGINLNYKDGSGNTVLHVLCDSHINETTLALGKKLLTAMCKVNEVNIAGETPLLMLLRGSTWYYHNPEKDDLIKCLLDNGADVNVKCPKDKKSTLRFAIECQYTELTKLLLNAGYDVNKREAGGELPIFYCFPLDTSKNTELFELILEAETFPNCVDSKGTSLLERVFQTLITERKHVGNDFFARVELPKTKFKIHDEIKPLFSLLLSKNANPNTAKEGEDSLLMKAITYEAEEIVLLLIKAGASMTHIGKNISSPLDVCCRLSEKIDIKGSQEPSLRMKDEGLRILNILLDNNLPLGNPNSIGKYPLDIVMGFDNTETEIQKMLSMGADPNKYDKNEECPLLISVYGSPSVTLDLLKAGADPQTTSKDGRSVYDLFTERIFYDDSLSCLDDGCAAEIQMRALARNEPSILMIEDTFYDCTTGSMIKSFLKKLNKRPAIKLCGKTMYVTYEDSVSCWKTVKWLEKFIETGDVRIDAKEDQNHWLNIKQKLNRRKCLSKEDNVQEEQTSIGCEVVKILMQTVGIDVNSKTFNGLLPLCVAVRLGSLPLLNFLLGKKADPNILDDMDETPLSLALIHGDMDIVKALVEANSNVNHIGFLPGNSSEQKESLLSRFLDKKGSCASLEQRTLLVNFLIKNGASVNLDKKGVDSPLIKAVKLAFFSFSQKKAQDVGLSLSALDLVAELLKLGSNINHGGKNLMTALHVYCKQKGGSIFTNEEEDDDEEDEGDSETGNVDEANNPLYKIFKLLLNSGASVNVQAKSGATPVHIGLRRRCIPEVLDMLNENFEANTKDASGVTCLMLAGKYGEEQIIKALLKCGADVNLEDESSNTALHYLCKTGQNMEILDTLVQGGSHINAVNKDGYSPLNIYVKEAQRLEKEIVIDLLSKGADPNCCPGGCESPLTNALNRVEYETAKVLLKAGALVNYISRSGISPLSMAVSKTKERRRFFAITEEKAKKTKQREEMVNCLLEAGADTNIQTENKTSLVCSLLSSPFRQDTLGILSDLLEHNGNPNIGTENPLCLAARLNIDIVKLLLKFGTNVNRKGSKENTPLVEYLLSLQTGKRDDQMEILKSLVEAGADTNIASNTGKCPLEIVLEDYLVLLDEGFVNKVRRASLWHSYYSEENAKLHLQKLLSLLIDAGANCSQRKMGADSVLHIAVAIGEKNIVEMLIKNGSDVNHIGENKDMPLHRYLKRDTTMNGTRETVLDVLLSYNANPNAKDGDGNTPLCLSLRTNAEDFRKLLAAGADPFSKEENVLQKCVMSDDLSFLNVLLQEKGTLFICNSLFSKFWERQNGVTFLRNRSLIATVTLQMLSSPQELNVNIKNRLGATPLLFFCEQNKDVVVKRLLERGADVNTVHNDGRTALHIIICSRDRDARYTILTLLMKKNPELKIMDSSGKTAFQRAEEEYQDNIYYKRIDYKWLSIFMKEALLAGQICEKSHLNSLLVLASQKKHFDLMTILVEKGADLTVKKDQKGVLHLCWSLQYHYEERANVSSEECLNFLRIYKKHGGKMDDLDRDGNTPLVLFLKHGLYDFDAAPDKLVDLRDEIVSLLACDGSTVRKRDNTGSSAIHIVSSEGWLSTMKILVQKGANISEKDDKQNTCLHLCSMGAPGEFLYDIIVYLVERKAVINELNIRGESPLFILVDKRGTLSELKCIDVIEYLLKKGALPNLHLKLCNPLVAAIRSASVKLIHLLLDYHAKVNEIEDGPTALHIFFRCFRSFNKINQDDIENVAHRILKKGANVNDRDDTGKTALHLAIKALCSVDRKCNTESIIQQLLDYGADINAVDKNGHTPLSIVCETRGSTDRAHLGCCLLSKGADPNIDFALNQCMRNIDYYGLNADWKIFILSLIQNGADPNQYRDGKPPIHFAIKSGHSDIVKFLIEKGVNIQSCDKDENTCLHLACDLKTESERYEIASLLLEHGCSVNKSNKCGTTPLSNVIKRMIEDTNSMKIEHSETATVAKVDLSLFNWLICGGAKIDPVVKTSTSYSYYGKSILSILLRNGFFGAAATLLKCGYNWKDDGDFKNVDFSNQENSTILINGKRYNRISYEQEKNLFLNVLKKQEEKEETSLSSLCRYAIRMNLTEAGQGAEIESKIMLLPVPGRIKTYLSLREHTQDFEQMQLESKESTPAGISIQTLMDAYYPRGIVIDEYYGRDDSDVDEYMYYHGNDSDSDDYYY